MRKFKFKGYGGDHPFYGDGAFTVGEVYQSSQVEVDEALFDDDNDEEMWEELTYFEEVTEDE